MEKKYLVGGLAVVGAIALFMYLKPKNKANSEGFFNMSGFNPQTNPFIPNSFTRQDRFCKVCVQYDKIQSPKGGFMYLKKLYNPNQSISEAFSITEQEYTSAFTKNGLCKVNPPTK
jgi:hypothetical protein